MEWVMNWGWATILGPVVLAGVMAYALMTRRRLTPNEKADQKRAIQRSTKREKK